MQKKYYLLYFGIKEKPVVFSARILVIIADILKEKSITAIYKLAKYKILCYNCIVLRDNLNNINLKPKNILRRISQNMQSVVKDCIDKEFSVHNIENTFWNFS